jgi:hypothetical protein
LILAGLSFIIVVVSDGIFRKKSAVSTSPVQICRANYVWRSLLESLILLPSAEADSESYPSLRSLSLLISLPWLKQTPSRIHRSGPGHCYSDYYQYSRRLCHWLDNRLNRWAKGNSHPVITKLVGKKRMFLAGIV